MDFFTRVSVIMNYRNLILTKSKCLGLQHLNDGFVSY